MKTKVVAAMMVLIAGFGGLAMDASAATYQGAGINIRSGTNTGTTVKGLGYAGQSVTLYSLVSGQTVTSCAHTSNGWWYHRNNSTGVTGYSTWACIA